MLIHNFEQDKFKNNSLLKFIFVIVRTVVSKSMYDFSELNHGTISKQTVFVEQLFLNRCFRTVHFSPKVVFDHIVQ
jgi:hypothetical protein